MELHVVAVRNLKEKKIDAFTNNHNFDTFFHFHCSQLLKPKLVRRNYESACLVRHHHCIYFYFVIFLIFEMEILPSVPQQRTFGVPVWGGAQFTHFCLEATFMK